jgi:predicted transcriptional regulator
MGTAMLNPKNVFSFVAGDEVKKNRFVAIYIDGKAILTPNIVDSAIGVALNDAEEGGVVDVATAGIVQVEARFDYNPGEEVISSPEGKATGRGGTIEGRTLAVALTAGAPGGLSSVLLK